MSEYKSGNEFLPYHPLASHVPPEYRDAWNGCYKLAASKIEALEREKQVSAMEYLALEGQCREHLDTIEALRKSNNRKGNSMTTSTKELIAQIELDAKFIPQLLGSTDFKNRLEAIAQRLRELDKPDCVWTNYTPSKGALMRSKSSCGGDWQVDDGAHGFCPGCRGAIKEAT